MNALKRVFEELDSLLHERGRLAIASVLAAVECLTFTELREQLGMTDGNLSVHLQKLEEWTFNKLLNAHLELLTSLVGRGQYFLIFNDYYQTMMYWGLKTASSDRQDASRSGSTELDKIISELRDGRREPPAPLVGSAVSREFLEIGSYLFSDPYFQEQTLEAARTKFNQAAGEIMPSLLNVIIGLNALPPSIKHLLSAYSERFFQVAEA